MILPISWRWKPDSSAYGGNFKEGIFHGAGNQSQTSGSRRFSDLYRGERLASENGTRIKTRYDLEPEEEHLIGRYFKEEYGADFVFVTIIHQEASILRWMTDRPVTLALTFYSVD